VSSAFYFVEKRFNVLNGGLVAVCIRLFAYDCLRFAVCGLRFAVCSLQFAGANSLLNFLEFYIGVCRCQFTIKFFWNFILGFAGANSLLNFFGILYWGLQVPIHY